VRVRVVFSPVRFSVADAANLPPILNRAGEARRSMFSHRCHGPDASRLSTTEEDESCVPDGEVTA
jgi:hypothetical protein